MMALAAHAAFSGAGAGTADDPYQVTNADEFFEIRNTPNACYILVNDIDLTEFIQDESPTMGWTPIPTFSGELDGNGMTLYGLFINRPGQTGVGLFSQLAGSTASVHDLVIDAPRVTGGQNTGVIAGAGGGTIYGVTINKAKVTSSKNYIGAVVGYNEAAYIEIYNITLNEAQVAGAQYVGGMVGYRYQTNRVNIHDCKIYDVAVTATSYAGGVLGGNYSSSYSSTTSFGSITNNRLVNVRVKASGNSVGGIIGGELGISVSSNVLIGGIVSGTSNVGGVAGEIVGASATYQNNYVSCDVTGTSNVGGIVGSMTTTRLISENYYSGTIRATGQNIGGIVGYQTNNLSTSSHIDYNFVQGKIKSTGNYVAGVLGYYSTKSFYMSYNVCVMDTISGSGNIRRIQTNMNSSTYVGDNYALASMVLMAGDQQVTVTADDRYNGISYGARTLKRASTYEGIGFDNSWTIVDGQYPWLAIQCAPPVITSAEGGTVAGTAEGNGKVYVLVGEKLYTGAVSGGAWSVAVDPLTAGEEVRVSVETGGKMPSVLVSAAAGDGGGGGDEPGPGDDPQPGDNEVALKVTSRFSTFTPAKAVTLNGVAGVKAYAATAYAGGKVTLTPVSEIPAGQGVIIEAVPGNYVLPTTTVTTCQSTYMMGCLSNTTVGKGTSAYTNLVMLEGDATTARFATVTSTTSVPAGKAYLRLPLSGVAQGSFALQFNVNNTGDFNNDGAVDVIDINQLINLILNQ